MRLDTTPSSTPLTSSMDIGSRFERSGNRGPQSGEIVVGFDNGIVVPTTALEKKRSIPDELFDATANAKIWASKVSMRLPSDVRALIFRQIDLLHDSEEWCGDGQPLELHSFKSFVRSILFHGIKKKPSIALMPSGNLAALWLEGASKLTVEFLSDDMVNWVVKSVSDDGPERASGTTSLKRLRSVLQPYNGGAWFNGS